MALLMVAGVPTLKPIPAHAHITLGHDSLSAITEHTTTDRVQALALFDAARQRSGALSESAAQTVCKQRSADISAKIHEASLSGVRSVNTLDSVFAGVQEYYAVQSLRVAQYEQLLSAVTNAQNAANIDIGAMAVLNRPLDCSGSKALVDVIAFRIASSTAQQSIGTYREMLMQLLQTLQTPEPKS